MTSKTSFPERWREFCRVYWWALKKHAGIFALLSVLMFVTFPMILMLAAPRWFEDFSHYSAIDPNKPTLSGYLSNNFSNMMHTLVPVAVISLVLLFGLILCVSLWGYMQTKRSVDLFHALPLGRVPMLLGRWCAGITVLFVPVVLNFIIVAIVCGAYGITPLEPLIITFLRVALMGTAALTSAMLMAVCSGTLFDTVVSILGVNAGYPLMIFLGGTVTNMILPGAQFDLKNNTIFATTALSPYASAYAVNMTSAVPTWTYVWWIAITAVLLFGSIYLYQKRGSESAEDNFAFPVPKIAIRFLLTAAGGLGLGLMLNNIGRAGFLIGVIAGSLIVHVVVEALYSRGFRRIWKSAGWYGAFAVAFLIFYGVVSTGFFGYDTRVPNAADVKSVIIEKSGYDDDEVMPNYSMVYGENGKEIKSFDPVTICQPTNIEKVINSQKEVVELYREAAYPYIINNTSGEIFTFKYQMKNGSVFIRKYQYYNRNWNRNFPESLKQKTKSIFKSEEYLKNSDLIFYLEPEYISTIVVDVHNNSQVPVILKGEEGQQLLSALQDDYMNSKINLDGKTSSLDIEIRSKNNIAPKGELKKLMGNYSGKISFGHATYSCFDKDSETYKLAQKLGWIK